MGFNFGNITNNDNRITEQFRFRVLQITLYYKSAPDSTFMTNAVPADLYVPNTVIAENSKYLFVVNNCTYIDINPNYPELKSLLTVTFDVILLKDTYSENDSGICMAMFSQTIKNTWDIEKFIITGDSRDTYPNFIVNKIIYYLTLICRDVKEYKLNNIHFEDNHDKEYHNFPVFGNLETIICNNVKGFYASYQTSVYVYKPNLVNLVVNDVSDVHIEDPGQILRIH